MKVLMLNGSWNQEGSTKAGLDADILPPANESGVFTNFVR